MPIGFRLLAVLLAAGLPASPAAAQPAPASCTETPGFAALDFWVGEWRVEVDGELAGTNRIERILEGCAVAETWRGAGGGEGRSLFYYLPATDEWKQVWVTGRATAPGGVKEKVLVARLDDGGLRFQGAIPLAGGGDYLDRTTLTPLEDGRVRQHIEVSTDGGASWRTTFDGLYLPVVAE